MNKKKEILRFFIGTHQLQGLTLAAQGVGEASRYFQVLLNKLRSRIVSMPKTYQTDGQGDKAIAQLHYCIGRSHWYVTERDMILPEQIQAYGYVCLNGDIINAEKGYIDVDELIRHGAEFDVYFKPAPLSEVKAKLTERRALWDTNY